MNAVLKYIANVFDVNVLALFIISSMFLLLSDCKEYEKEGFKKEYKFSKFFGYFYIIVGVVLYVATKFIRL